MIKDFLLCWRSKDKKLTVIDSGSQYHWVMTPEDKEYMYARTRLLNRPIIGWLLRRLHAV